MPTLGSAIIIGGLLDLVRQWVGDYGILAVCVGLLLETLGLPAPGETLLIAGAAAAGQGRLDIRLLLPLAWMAAVMGDNVGFLIGRTGGTRLLRSHGRYLLIRPATLDRAEAFFHRWGPLVVLGGRFVHGLRQLNGIIAGAMGMDWRLFILCNAAGAAAWVGFWGLLAYWLGGRVEAVVAAIRSSQWYLLAGLAVLAATVLAWRRWRR